MAHLAFPRHSKTVRAPSSSTSYAYLHIPPAPSNPTILFLHGFPSSSYDWRHQISHFSSLGYGVLTPDLLGYGDTDKPHDPAEYKGKKMATEVIDILDHEKLDTVHAVSHDFGSHLLSRIVNYFPSRLLSCTFIAVPYTAPAQHLDLDKVKDITEQALGFEKFGYMRFMNRDDAPAILQAHSESFTSLLYTSDHALATANFYPPGALERYLTTTSTPQTPSILSPSETTTHNRIFAASGYRGPTNWYRALIGNLSEADERAALASGAIAPQIPCPVLAIDSAPGPTSLPGFMEGQVRAFSQDVRVKTAKTEGHWVQIESRDEVNAWLQDFFVEVGGLTG